MNLSEQKLIIENLLSSKDVFSRCIGIIKPDYFDIEYRSAVRYISEYFEKYHNIPSSKALNAKFPEMNYEYRDHITVDEEKYTCDEIEIFCQQQALFSAIEESVPKIAGKNREDFVSILQAVQAALEVSLTKDVGLEMFDDPEAHLRRLLDVQIYEPTGIEALDEALGGGLGRKQCTLFSANSGQGKSIMLANIGANYAKRGYRVLLLSLELTEDMVFLRNASIMSGVKTFEWRDNIPNIAQKLNEQSENGGSFVIKRIPNGSCANDMRAYLKHYELTFKAKPDVIIVDYLDLMTPNGGIKNMSISDQDKAKSEELVEIGHTYNSVMISASQQNRDALKLASPDQSVIAGGISKINIVDNFISIFMDPAMRLQGDMLVYFLKTRSASAVGTSRQLKFNADNLQITDTHITQTDIMAISSKKNKLKRSVTTDMNLPGLDDDAIIGEIGIDAEVINYEVEEVKSTRPITKKISNENPLLNLMQSLGDMQ